MLCILCSGQGDQRADLFSRLRRNPDAARLLDLAVREKWVTDEIAAWLAAESPDATLLHTDRFAQPLLCLYQQAVWSALAPHLGRVSLFAGLSLGELSAAGCAGALDPSGVVRIAARRAELMDAAAPSGRLIAVLGLEQDAISALCADTDAAIAIQTGPDHWTLGCLAPQCDTVVQTALARGASVATPLGITVASHTHWLESSAAPFRTALLAANLKHPRAPILAGTTAQRLFTPEQIVTALCDQIHTRLRWDLCLDAALSAGIRTFLELGPGVTLSHTVLARDATLSARSVDEFSSLSEAVAWASRH